MRGGDELLDSFCEKTGAVRELRLPVTATPSSTHDDPELPVRLDSASYYGKPQAELRRLGITSERLLAYLGGLRRQRHPEGQRHGARGRHPLALRLGGAQRQDVPAGVRNPGPQA